MNIKPKKILFKKSQRRLMMEIRIKQLKELNDIVNDILEDEGLGDKIGKIKIKLLPNDEGIMLFENKTISKETKIDL